MRKLILCAAFILATSYAVPSMACEECAQYFDYQSLNWCSFCQYSSCGYFNCEILFGSFCTGDDPSCFEYGGHCSTECDPDDPNSCVLHQTRLDESWRLIRVHVDHPQPPRAPVKAAAIAQKG